MGMPVITSGTISRSDAIGNIIESVAMEESALAHILNAESEKIMSALNSINATAEDILTINASVKDSVSCISRLEMQLQAKLDMFQEAVCK